jgi:AcrR family transcriptional regulator
MCDHRGRPSSTASVLALSFMSATGRPIVCGQIVEAPRARILRAMVEVAAERGFAGATVGLVVRRASVSTRTFYRLFDGLEGCLVAVMDNGLEEVVALASRELAGARRWQDGLRAAFAAVLTFFDADPESARVLIVESLAGGPIVLGHRERTMATFRSPVIERIEKEIPEVAPLTAEGVLSAVLGIMHAHIVEQRPGAFVELIGPLMGLAVAPYLASRGVQKEIEQGHELARRILTGDTRWSTSAQATEQDAGLHGTLGNPRARRARECLLFLAEQGGRGLTPSNREIAVGIGVAHQSQISKLLRCLAEADLVVKRSGGEGKCNSWRLTPAGEQVVRSLTTPPTTPK